MTTETISLRDLGTDFEVTIMEGAAVVDVSAATALEIEFKSPGGTKTVKTASLVNDGTDGKIHYKRLSGDIARKGTWSYLGIATFSATEKYHSISPVDFLVID